MIAENVVKMTEKKELLPRPRNRCSYKNQNTIAATELSLSQNSIFN